MAGIRSRRTWMLAGALLLLALLGVLAWRWSPVARDRATEVAASSATVDEANAPSSAMAPATLRARAHAPVEAGAATDPLQARCQRQRTQQLRLARERLRNPASPEQAIQHALLSQMLALRAPTADAEASVRAVGSEWRAARRRWPDDLELAWSSMRNCNQARGCDPDAEWRHLATLDPDNAAVWMLAMDMAAQRHDDTAYDEALRRAAGAKFHDSRIGGIFLRMWPLLATLPLPDACRNQSDVAELTGLLGHAPSTSDWAGVEASSLELAFGIPAYGSLSGCSLEAPAMSAQRRRDCIALLPRIAAGFTLLEDNVALRFLIPLAGDGADGMALRERYRRLRWLWTQVPRTHMPKDYFSRMWVDGEIALLTEAAITQHRWPPPPDWLPEDERGRSLVINGNVPPEHPR